MVTATSERQAHAWARRAAPEPEQILPGLWSIALPAKDNPIAYTINYVFLSDEGIALADTGWSGAESVSALDDELGKLGFTTADIRFLLVTHMHPDHFGLVPELLASFPDCTAIMHDRDLRLVDERSDEQRERTMPRWSELMRSLGAPADLEIMKRMAVKDRVGPEIAGQVRTVEDGEVIEFGPWCIRAIWSPGHTPGHLCYYEENHQLLISGDHVLPTITPQVSQLSDPDDDILATYLASLRRLRSLAVREVLPAHQYRFLELHERVEELLGHHENRLSLLEDSAKRAPGSTCFELAHELDWRDRLDEMPTNQRRMAVKETLAHLTHLQREGRLRREPGPPATWWLTESPAEN